MAIKVMMQATTIFDAAHSVDVVSMSVAADLQFMHTTQKILILLVKLIPLAT